ncbi:YbaN family protein [Bacteriovoracaceae bacterium]|nr:YbaN family protein [Bacteriovoracaceae bacterium]
MALPKKFLYFVGGWIALLLALIGAILPVMPTTPFIILAAYCFKRGSDKVHDWLLRQPVVGETIKDWDKHRVIQPKYKVMAFCSIIISFGYIILFRPIHFGFKIGLFILGCAIIFFVMRQNSTREV